MQKTETANIIFFEEVPLKINHNQLPQMNNQPEVRLTQQQMNHINEIDQQYQTFQKIYEFILNCVDRDQQSIEKICKAISDYMIYLVKYQKQQIFFQHSVKNKFIALLLNKMESYNFLSDIVKIVFSSLEYLLRAINKDQQYVYFLVCINKEGFLTTKYQFQEDDAPYFANFLKLLIRKINQDQKYLNIFFNQKEPQFPLLLNLLRFHDQKDQILRTSVSLTLIQICSNQSKYIQKYISNFPFVMFYPIYVYQIYNSFLDAISDNQRVSQQGKQTLKTALKFMEDFIQNKDRQAVQMYSNCFMSLIGRIFYKELSELNKNNEQKVIRMLKVFYEIIVKDISILKIKIGLGQFFIKKIGKNVNKFLKSKIHHIEFTYWIPQSCKQDILQHCQRLYPKNTQSKNSPKSSFIKLFNSYIPHTKDNWLYHEIRKISQLIGFEIELNKEINFEQYLQGSYLKAIQLDINDQQCQNQAYEKLLKYESEEILFYYIQLISQLKVPLKRQGIDQNQTPQTVLSLLQILNRATSLSLLKSFYKLVHHNQLYINQIKNTKVKSLYENVLQKLIYFILTQGWNAFYNRSKISIKQEQNQQYSPDIFRDLECDILYFVGLRHILGTKNNQGLKDDKQFIARDTRRMETKANCWLLQQLSDNSVIEQPIQIVLDGQYIKLFNQQQHLVSHQNILINRSYINQNEGSKTIQIIVNQNNNNPKQQYYLIEFGQSPIKNYISKQIKYRRQIIMDLELKLRLMMFQLIE